MLAVICNFMPLYALHLPIYGLQQNCLKSKCASIHTAQFHIKYTRLAKSIQEHREIKNTILDGNAEKAANLMRDHIMLQGQRLPLLLRNAN